jgi:hypothetical protein
VELDPQPIPIARSATNEVSEMILIMPMRQQVLIHSAFAP